MIIGNYKILLGMLLLLPSPICLGQLSSNGDSIATHAKYDSLYRGLYGAEWSKTFIQLWNGNKDTARVLGGMGDVYFVSTDADTVAALFHFDSAGQARLMRVSSNTPTDTIPTFTSPLFRWAEFMEGKFTAFAGVLGGKIKYKGSITLAIKYGRAFDKVAPVGKRASSMIFQRRHTK